jgi:DNA-binding LytR/AlgR family response regulator
MNTFRALIAEDEPVLAAMLAATLQRAWPELQIVATAPNGVAAVEEALAQQPDVLFLDIRMPGKTGLEAAQELAEEWPEGEAFPLLVFVTAYDEYAIAAFEQAAVDYVQKPVSEARLAKTVTRLRERLEKPRGGELDAVLTQLRALAAPGAPGSGNAPVERLTMIRAAVGNTVRLIPIDEVLYFEATDKYVNVVTAEGEALIRTPLKDLLPGLDAQRFWQIHRGTVVNIRQVTAALRDETGKLRLALKGRRETLPVSRVYAHLFRQM